MTHTETTATVRQAVKAAGIPANVRKGTMGSVHVSTKTFEDTFTQAQADVVREILADAGLEGPGRRPLRTEGPFDPNQITAYLP